MRTCEISCSPSCGRNCTRPIDAHGEDGQAEFQKQTGIDIENDIDRVVAFMEPDAAGEGSTGMVVATGRFDQGRLEALAREHGGLVEDYGGKRLISKADIEHEGGYKSKALAFLDTGVVAFGETVVVKRAIDRRGAGSVTENTELMDLVQDIDDSNAWAVGRFDALMSRAKLPDDVASKIPSVKLFSASGHINGGLTGLIRAETRDEQAGQNLRDVVQGFLALAKMQANSQPELQALVNSLQLSGTGKTVALSFQVPSQVIDTLAAASKRPRKTDRIRATGYGLECRGLSGLIPTGVSPFAIWADRPVICSPCLSLVFEGMSELVFFYGTLMTGFDRRRRLGMDERLPTPRARLDHRRVVRPGPVSRRHSCRRRARARRGLRSRRRRGRSGGARPDRGLPAVGARRQPVCAPARSGVLRGRPAGRSLGLLLQRSARPRAPHRFRRLSRVSQSKVAPSPGRQPVSSKGMIAIVSSCLRVLVVVAAVLNPTSEVTAQSLDPDIITLLDSVSAARLEADIRALAAFGTRHTYSDTTSPTRGIGAARQWIHDQFVKASPKLQVAFDSHQVVAQGGRLPADVELRNVMAVLPGRSPRRIYVSGHYDTVARRTDGTGGQGGFDWTRADNDAPGANDDGSGTALVIELARVFGQSGLDFDATIVFIALAGEEQGLVGAKLHAQRATAEGWRIDAVLNNDIVGNSHGGAGAADGDRVRVFSEGPEDSASRAVARYVRQTAARYQPGHGVDLVARADRFGRGGDHTSFNQHGFAAVRFTEANDTRGSTPPPTHQTAWTRPICSATPG